LRRCPMAALVRRELQGREKLCGSFIASG
jgi:hypothetical protein